mmetsp:Transcript_18261/g.26784  ORF Transcript_18261/g.26784 Transcript_18261/m.26784 type:complete len:95 (-) Transcript_18261:1769-2053(-)
MKHTIFSSFTIFGYLNFLSSHIGAEKSHVRIHRELKAKKNLVLKGKKGILVDPALPAICPYTRSPEQKIPDEVIELANSNLREERMRMGLLMSK